MSPWFLKQAVTAVVKAQRTSDHLVGLPQRQFCRGLEGLVNLNFSFSYFLYYRTIALNLGTNEIKPNSDQGFLGGEDLGHIRQYQGSLQAMLGTKP